LPHLQALRVHLQVLQLDALQHHGLAAGDALQHRPQLLHARLRFDSV